ncbi:nicotinamide mononucleotide transporter [Marinigracilibium pacificum]|uniref:Nicotinamide mononucleotide transporter n=1 Tax=Marinigracilibium pacificum TaxID=2729599 RepID=A0A848J8G5_9BACT|nr:nicotinamide mononucleotide transporter [Marinigracilibium pacificum]NMM50669.1 nicotinamide mononucleotide transporter [Marinigracilibium pacificum]
MDNIFEYYLIDWLGISLSLLAVYMLGNKNQWGFIVFAVSNIVWIYLGLVLMNSLGTAIGNAVFLIINIRGFINWYKQFNTSENSNLVRD